MRNSLVFKLLGAFLLVIALGSMVISWAVSRATANAFNMYSSRNGQIWAQNLAPVIADYYAQNAGWQGVNSYLQADSGPGDSQSLQESNLLNNEGMGSGRGMRRGRPGPAGGMMRTMGQRLILADRTGAVISDSQNELLGTQLSPDQLSYGTPVLVDNQSIGTLLVTAGNISNPTNPGGQFLTSVNHSIVISVVLASLLALFLGAGLFFQITSPLRQLKKAATAIAQGNLNERVAIRSHDEFGELGLTFNHMAESLQKAELQRQHMVADIAHELRTPLAAIQATLEGMSDGVLPLDQEQVNVLQEEAILLNRLVGDLRLLSLAEAGQLIPELREVNLPEFVQQVVERHRPQAIQKNITLSADVMDLPAQISMDPDRITQVMSNLIGNALRYTPENGTITVQAHLLPDSPRSLEISVSDTGPGIAVEDLPFIFDRFYRADKSRSRGSGGSGLGLAIVKQLVEAHGGSVKATSPILTSQNNNYGTRISFTLPGDISEVYVGTK